MLAAAGVDPDAVSFRYGIDARYRGQGNEITIWLGEGDSVAGSTEAMRSGSPQYEAVYGMTIPDVPVEVVTWRISRWLRRPARGRGLPVAEGDPVPHRMRQARFDRAAGPCDTRCSGASLGAGASVAGPALLEERETTACCGRGGRRP